MTTDLTPDGEVFSPDSINTPEELGKLLDLMRLLSGLTESDLAKEVRIDQITVKQILNGQQLPGPSELHNLLLALKVRSRERQEQWEYALIRARSENDSRIFRPYVLADAKTASSNSHARTGSSDSKKADEPGLLFRVYIPSTRLYAEEASKLLSLFREWLTMTRGIGLRQAGYHTASGEVYEFFVDDSAFRADLNEEFDNFSDFLTMCSEEPSAAADVLTSTGIDRTSSTKLVTRFGREVQRLQIDLRHEREQRMLTIRHGLEEQLLESGVDLRDIPRSQINALIDSNVPGPTATESLTLLSSPWIGHSKWPITVINNPQIISAIESTIIQSVQGTVHLGTEAKKLLDFIEKYGGQEADTLQSAVHELDDPAAPSASKSGAKQVLSKFVNQLAGMARDIGVGVLADFLKSKGI
jgi:transcriptional regulator with XRE-family HTH domain